ncbi:hypothetical protein [Aurantimonas sp. 22II-16-19i]|uniref:hypothetical protein n=1 Tax=Aurantimonas sp. 22II-16-19i TaxID=1317114 RepID=UPI0009FA5FC8|nr:hypothetical protein [Aurantimonas sp. 22II-16-19i]
MADDPTLSNLLAQMAQDKEVLNGWDAVLNVLESAVDAFFQAQFVGLTAGSGQMTIAQVFCGPALSSPHGTYCVVTQVSFTLAAPSFVFTGGSNTVTVTQAITAGSTCSGTMPVASGFQPASCGCTPNDGRVTWGPVQTIDVGSNPSISAAVPLTSVTGLIDATTHTVLLDFANGAFTVTNVTIDGVTSQELADQIRSWFATHGVTYQVASVDFGSGTIAALTPTGFQFNVLQTNSGNIVVQLLITTDGTPASGDPIVLEPVPTASGYTCSLMISSRIVFANILCVGFNGAGKPFSLYPQSPSASEGYSAYIAPQMHFSGSFSYGSCCDKTTVTYSLYLGGTYSGTATDGFFLYQSITPSGNVGNTITVAANNPVSLSGSGASQAIQITPQAPSVTVTGGASGTINSELQSILSSDFTSAMAGISFGPITYFALRNVLFPSSLMTMSVVAVPTDLVIVGTFEAN